MKAIKYYLSVAMLGLCAVAGLSSCLSDDESSSNTIDAATQKTYQSNISVNGPYVNNARFYMINTSAATTTKYDSIMNKTVYASYRTDSTFTVSGLPVSKLDSAVYVTNTSERYASLRDAIHNCTDNLFTGMYCIPTTSYATTSGYQFAVGMTKQVKLNYDGADHNVLFVFNSNMNYSLGVWTKSGPFCELQLYLSDIYIDYKSTSDTGTRLSYFRPIVIVMTNK